MSKQSDLISFLKLNEKFKAYFDVQSNRQILFSGPFGSGKTTFLRDFFLKSEDYETIHIFPVNYSLHSNSDIYEIIKYDIILELISKGAFRQEDISDLSKYVYVTAQAGEKAFVKLLSLFSKTGKQIKKAVDLLGDAQKDVTLDFDQLSNPLLGVSSFGEIMDKVQGYSYDDYITSLIKEKLSILPKKKVLIVDDLDRIDPDHLFRVISVFSAHIDHNTEENKFGFDKIIFVGDIQNFKGMFNHKFGSRNNFQAFISKLNSKNPFHFDPEKELYLKIPDILGSFQFVSETGEHCFHLSDYRNFNDIRFFGYIISCLISDGKISLRELQKKKDIPIKINSSGVLHETDIPFHDSSMYNLWMLLGHFIPHNEVLKVITELTMTSLPLENCTNPDESSNILASRFSTVPLNLLLNRKKYERNIEGQTFNHNFNSLSLDVQCYLDPVCRSLCFRLTEKVANENNLIRLTKEALEDVSYMIK